MARRLTAALALALLGLALLAAPAAAQDDGDDPGGTTTTVPVIDEPDIDFLPDPNSGRPPEESGDRGGAGQLLLFGAVIVGILAIVGLALRDMRRSRSRARTEA